MTNATSNPSIAVVGGGVVGLSIAWELSKRRKRVTCFDANRPKPIGSLSTNAWQATSWTAAGILPPATIDGSDEPIDRLRGLSHRLYPKWSKELQRQTQIDVELDRVGGIYMATRAGEAASLAGSCSFWEEQGIEVQKLSPSQIIDKEPSLQPAVGAGLILAAYFTPDEYQIRPPRLLAALRQACCCNGVEFFDGVQAHRVAPLDSGAGVSIEWSPSSAIDSPSVERRERKVFDQVVLCGGVHSNSITIEGIPKPQRTVVPVRGQMLLLKTDEPLIRSVLNVGNRYIVARRDGHTLVGSCEEEAGMDRSTSVAMEEEFAAFATQMVPSLKGATVIDRWAGLRPMTFDGFPMIGPLGLDRSIWIAAGHYRSGIHLSPATAVCLADLMDGQIPAVDLQAFHPVG